MADVTLDDGVLNSSSSSLSAAHHNGRRLHQGLADILTDTSSAHSMLPYFIQYMDACSAMHLVEFWLAVESFRSGRDHSVTSVSSIHRHRYHLSHPSVSPSQSWSCSIGKDVTASPLKDGYSHNSSHQCHGQISDVMANGSETMCSGVAEVVGVRSSSKDVESVVAAEEPSHDKSKAVLLERPTRTEAEDREEQEAVASDAIEIYSTYVALNALKPVEVSADVRHRIEVTLCPEDGRVQKWCFDEAQKCTFTVMERQYYPPFLNSAPLAQYQLQVIGGDSLHLLDILNCPNASLPFREFVELEGCSHLLEFWYMAENFSKDLFSQPGHRSNEADLELAMHIYDRYISLQATESLGLHDNARQEVEVKICDTPGPRWDSFAVATATVLERLRKEYFRPFKQSQLFLQYQNQLLHTISEGDDCSEDPSSELGTASEQVVDLDDPEELWCRAHLPLRFGYIDEVGAFISEAGLETFLRTRDGKLLSEKKFFKVVGREPAYAKHHRLLIQLAQQVIAEVKSDAIESGVHVDED